MTTTEPTINTEDILLFPEVRMPAAIVAQMQSLIPRLKEVLPTIAELAAEMEDVSYWLNVGGAIDSSDAYDRVHDRTPYGEVFMLFEQIGAHVDAARSENPSQRVDWYDRLKDRLDHALLEAIDDDPRLRQIYEDRIRTRALDALEEG